MYHFIKGKKKAYLELKGHHSLLAMPRRCERLPEGTASTTPSDQLLLDSWLEWRLTIEENGEVGTLFEEKVKASSRVSRGGRRRRDSCGQRKNDCPAQERCSDIILPAPTDRRIYEPQISKLLEPSATLQIRDQHCNS
jgi:hypothetical protein